MRMKAFNKTVILGLVLSLHAHAGLKEEREALEQQQKILAKRAATEIQRIYRGHLVRKGSPSEGRETRPSSSKVSTTQAQEVQTDPMRVEQRFRTLCEYCVDKDVNTVFPCGHASACSDCAVRFISQRCPTCRKNIESFGPLFVQGIQEVTEVVLHVDKPPTSSTRVSPVTQEGAPHPRPVSPAHTVPVQQIAPLEEGQGSIMDRFRGQFVQIPAGRLADGTQIEAVEADKYPVTRELWNVIMGGMPEHVPADQRASWNRSPRVPVTHVNWENADRSRAEIQDFIDRLNQREIASGCTYALPGDKLLLYLNTGDPSGENQDPYSAGVTEQNVDQFVNYRNSNGQIQPVGLKTPNRFGIELGNVWKISKDLYDAARPSWGRSVRGGSWCSDVRSAGLGVRDFALAGYRSGNMGFSLVRTCR